MGHGHAEAASGPARSRRTLLVRLGQRAPARIGLLLPAGLILILVWSASLPNHDISGPYMLTSVGALGVFVAHVGRLIRTLLDSTRLTRDDRPACVRRAWRWLATPALLLVIVSEHATQWPLRLRFAVSRPALERAVRDFHGARSAEIEGRRCGLYFVESAYARTEAEWIIIVGANIADGVGFLYDPTDSREESCTSWRIAPCWYTYES